VTESFGIEQQLEAADVFFKRMEERLRENAHKPDWRHNDTLYDLILKFHYKYGEVAGTQVRDTNPNLLVDMANYLMMIHDKLIRKEYGACSSDS
jgi:hypothetical protein